MRRNHWRIIRSVTGVAHRSQRSSSTCSWARTVAQDGHQTTGASAW